MGFIRTNPGNVEYLVIPNYPADTSIVKEPPNQNEASKTPVETVRKALILALESKVNDLMHGESVP
jgi:hypothetical protein